MSIRSDDVVELDAVTLLTIEETADEVTPPSASEHRTQSGNTMSILIDTLEPGQYCSCFTRYGHRRLHNCRRPDSQFVLSQRVRLFGWGVSTMQSTNIDSNRNDLQDGSLAANRADKRLMAYALCVVVLMIVFPPLGVLLLITMCLVGEQRCNRCDYCKYTCRPCCV